MISMTMYLRKPCSVKTREIKMKQKIAFATGSRAEYGIVRRYLSFLNDDSEVELNILVTGALLDENYGKQVKLIDDDGFFIAKNDAVPINTSSNAGIIHTMACVLDDFGKFFESHVYSLLIILGDRYEMLSIATAAAMQRIPILHIHGGEATYANYDEFIRHSITKMSYFHFTSTEEYKRRVIQLGESPERVFNLGALGAENCLYIEEENVPIDVKKLPKKKYFVILFHPETLTNVNPLFQVQQILQAVSKYHKYKYVFIGSNADTHSDIIRNAIYEFVKTKNNAYYFENLHTDGFHALLKNSICLIGNSSSGIIEAPSLGIYTINIGDRQKGRVRGNSVLDIPCDKEHIIQAIQNVLNLYKYVHPVNPYYKAHTAENYYSMTKNILKKIQQGITKIPKEFYDIQSD